MTEILLPRKRMLHAHGKKIVVARGLNERPEHVLMKVFLWALYLPQYPELTIEVPIGDRYKPDVVMLDAHGKPLFWGESGQVGKAKIESLVRRYRDTHFAIAKWDMRLDLLEKLVRDVSRSVERSAPFDLLSFPPDSAARFIDAEGNVRLTFDAIEWVRIMV